MRSVATIIFIMVALGLAGTGRGAVTVKSQTESSLELLFDLDEAADIIDSRGQWRGLELPGFASMLPESAGLLIPARTYLVAVPPGCDVGCEVNDLSYYKISNYMSKTSPVEMDILMESVPRVAVEVVADGYLWNQRVVCLRVAPVVFEGESNTMRVYRKVGARITFDRRSSAAGRETGVSRAGSDEEVYKRALLNYEQGRQWRRRSELRLDDGDYFSDSSMWIKIKVETTGIYCITGDDLEAAGANIGVIQPGTIRMYGGGGLPLRESLLETNPDWMKLVPVKICGADDGRFDDRDSILFYGLGMQDWAGFYDRGCGVEAYYKSFYSDYNCYWLTWGGSFNEPARRMETVDLPACDGCILYQPQSFLERVHRESNVVNDFSVHAEDGWYWRLLGRGDVSRSVVATPSPDIARPAMLKVRVADWHGIRECQDAYYRVTLRLNGDAKALVDSIWPAYESLSDVVDVAADTVWLRDSHEQTVEIYTPSALPPQPPYEGKRVCNRLYLAWYELFYWRQFTADRNRLFFLSPDTTATTAYEIDGFTTPSLYLFDVTDQFNPKELKGAEISGGLEYVVAITDTVSEGNLRRYAVISPGALLEPASIQRVGIADIRHRQGNAYCVVTHEDLLDAASLIAAFYDGEVVTVDQIYDEFAWGVPDITAIRDFLRWRYESAAPLASVLLLGEATWDYKGYLSGSSYPNYVPSYEKRYLLPVGDPYATDDWFVYLAPAWDDSVAYFPTVGISRMPAASPDEAELMVTQTIEYVSDPQLGMWQNRVLLVADDDRVGSSCEAGGRHTTYTEELSDEAFPRVFEHIKLYLTEYVLEPTGVKSKARRDFLEYLNQGVLVTNFVGHGDEYRFAQEEVFNPASIGLVQTGRRQTFLVAASCNVSRFDEPALSSMAEELLRRPEGATIGSLASTHFCQPTPNQILNLTFVQQLFPGGRKYPTARVADAAMVAKALTVGIGKQYYRNNEMFALLGDPAVRLSVPRLDVLFDAASEDTLLRKDTSSFSASVFEGGEPAPWFNGTWEMHAKEAEDTTGYVSCAGQFYDYELPGGEIFRARWSSRDSVDLTFLVPADAREGRGAVIHGFVTDGQSSGSGLLDSLVISGESSLEDAVGPEIEIFSGGGRITSGDTVSIGGRIDIRLSDPSGVAIKGKSEFIPSVSVSIDDIERIDLSDSVFSVEGDFQKSAVGLTIPTVTGGWHKFTFSAFDNLNNLTAEDLTLFVGWPASQAGNIVYIYPNPTYDACYIVCEYERQAEADVAIYTVSGRKVWEISSGPSTYHEILWEGLDMAGDPVSSGAYLVIVEGRDPSDPGFSATNTAAVALIR